MDRRIIMIDTGDSQLMVREHIQVLCHLSKKYIVWMQSILKSMFRCHVLLMEMMIPLSCIPAIC